MLRLPSEVRLLIYRFILVYDYPISHTELSTSNTSILRACRLFRQEGIPVFYQHNRFVLQASNTQPTLRVCKAFRKHAYLIKSMILDVRSQGSNYVDLIWYLLLLSRDLEATFIRALREFQALQALSIRLTTSCNCIQHQTQIEETLCTSFREGCSEFTERVVEQCGRFGMVRVSYLDERSVMITTTTPAAA